MNKKLVRNQSLELHQVPDDKDEYSTFDLGAAASLITAGFQLVSLDKANPHKVKFIFAKKPGLDEAVNSYWNFNLKIDAQTYFNQIKRLKNQIYSS